MNDKITLCSEMSVELMSSAPEDVDHAACVAARVSTGRDGLPVDPERDARLIDYLIRNGHLSPFEQNMIAIRAEVPIFVARQWMRHRVGWSFNETSGRYRELEPRFYLPPPYRLESSDDREEPNVEGMIEAYRAAWRSYRQLLSSGVSREVARTVLPVGLYTTIVTTSNVRSLAHFLDLRAAGGGAQEEITRVADRLEAILRRVAPVTYDAWTRHR